MESLFIPESNQGAPPTELRNWTDSDTPPPQPTAGQVANPCQKQILTIILQILGGWRGKMNDLCRVIGPYAGTRWSYLKEYKHFLFSYL